MHAHYQRTPFFPYVLCRRLRALHIWQIHNHAAIYIMPEGHLWLLAQHVGSCWDLYLLLKTSHAVPPVSQEKSVGCLGLQVCDELLGSASIHLNLLATILKLDLKGEVGRKEEEEWQSAFLLYTTFEAILSTKACFLNINVCSSNPAMVNAILLFFSLGSILRNETVMPLLTRKIGLF